MSTVPVGPVVFSATVNGLESPNTPLDYELHQEWGKHDLFFVRLVVKKGLSYTHLLQAWPDDSAVDLTWGRYPTSVQHWYGYINHHVVSTNDDASGQNVQITYVFIGTSAKMNGDKNRSWKGYTPTSMASVIARDHSLRCVVTSTDWVLPYEVQANESDFQFLNRIADKVGMRFWVSGGTLYFIDPVALLSGASNFFIPQYVINKQAYTQDSAMNFELLQGNYIPGANKMARTVYGVDTTTGQVIQATADGATSTDQIINIHRNVTSAKEAKQIANASQSLGQFWRTGSVEVFGYSLLYPGKMVNLSGAAMPDNTAGNWMVSKATHILKMSYNPNPVNDQYITRLTILSNATASIPFVKGVHKISPEIMPCTLRSGTWQAQMLNTVIEGVI